jgi:uncharacterized protein (DUF849 family)
MAAARKVIITCAVTGSIHTPTMTPYLPITPEQIARDAIDAAEAGASIIDLHADARPGRVHAVPAAHQSNPAAPSSTSPRAARSA